MDNLTAPGLFYALLLIYVVCMHRHQLLKKMLTTQNMEALKYQAGSGLFFLFNINLLFYCSFTAHCNILCISLSLSAVIIGVIVYIWHLIVQTIHALKNLSSGKFDLMAPFFSIPYFNLISILFKAAYFNGLEVLHSYENKMLIVLLYPFFVIVREFTIKLKRL